MDTHLGSRSFTFLFSDLVGSTRLWERHAVEMTAALARHDEILRQAITTNRGQVVKSTGDGVHAVFADAGSAIVAAVTAQRALVAEPWGVPEPLRVRMGLNSGEAEARDGDYFGTTVNRAARLMAVAHGGQIVLAEATSELVRDVIPGDFDLIDLGQHRLRDLSRPERVFQVWADGLERDFPRLLSLHAERTNLPVQLASFVGRDDELEQLAEFLTHARLVSLVGPGGCGKTRLAVEAGAELLEDFRDGVWFVDLSAVYEPELVAQTVATTLGHPEEAGRSHTETLLVHLSASEMLLVLDNCEQLIDECATLSDQLLRGSPSLRIVATSREPLGVAGEVTWRVPSLGLPPPDCELSVEQVPAFGALTLFFDRVQRARPGYPITDETIRLAAEICRRLDGIPLALELAAARVRLLSIEDVLAGLSDQLRLLSGGPRTAVPRHQTIAASIAWSHDLLTEMEQLLFRRISVFTGAFDLDAAVAVCSDDSIDRRDVVDVLGELVDRSLVLLESDVGVSRFRMLETIRQFGSEQLAQAHEADRIRSRMLAHYLAFAERSAPLLEGRDERETMDRLEQEHNNLRAALDWSSVEDVESGLRLATALHYFWYVRGYYSEGSRWLALLLDAGADVAPIVRANALYADSYLSGWALGHFETMIPRIEECLALAREADDPRAAGRALWALGSMLASQQPGRACDALEEAVELARRAGDTWCLSSALAILGTCRFNSEGGVTAFAHLDEAVVVARRNGHFVVLVGALGAYGSAALSVGQYDDAERLLVECLSVGSDVGHRIWIANALQLLAVLAVRRGRSAEAHDLAEQAYAAARSSASPPVMMGAEATLGLRALSMGDAVAAVRHCEDAIGLASEISAPSFTAAHLVTLAEARLALGDLTAAREAVEAGRELAHVGRPLTQAQLLNMQGRVARAEQDIATAERFLHVALDLFEDVGDRQGRADTLEDLAGVSVDRLEFEDAAELFGAADALREDVGYVRSPHRQAVRDADVERAVAALGARRFEALSRRPRENGAVPA